MREWPFVYASTPHIAVQVASPTTKYMCTFALYRSRLKCSTVKTASRNPGASALPSSVRALPRHPDALWGFSDS